MCLCKIIGKRQFLHFFLSFKIHERLCSGNNKKIVVQTTLPSHLLLFAGICLLVQVDFSNCTHPLEANDSATESNFGPVFIVLLNLCPLLYRFVNKCIVSASDYEIFQNEKFDT